MERSQDLLDTYTRILDAFSRGGGELDEFLSASPALSGIGTDPAEWWVGQETVRQILTAQLRAFADQGAQFMPSGAEAWAAGDLGWVIDQPTIRMRDGRKVPLRATTIFNREGGTWKMVHQHASIGVPNVEVEAFLGI
jgi:hypothetical protein